MIVKVQMRKLNMEGGVLIQGQRLKKGPRPGELKASAKQKEKLCRTVTETDRICHIQLKKMLSEL